MVANVVSFDRVEDYVRVIPYHPLLFLLCSEGLSSLLQQSIHSSTLAGLKIAPTAPTICHMFFADHTLLFTRATQNDCQRILQILREYEIALGSPGHHKYLGLPSLIGRQKKEVFQSIKTRVRKRLQGWNGRLLSRGAKEVLIKAVVQAIPTYTMGCFQLPKRLMNDLTGLMHHFWWGSSGGKRGLPWISWSKLSQPKALGGLSFRSIDEFNRALLGKQCWRIIRSPTSLVSRVLKAKYFPRCSFWDAHFGRQPSYAWRSILWGRPMLEQGGVWRIEAGFSGGQIVSDCSNAVRLVNEGRMGDLLDPSCFLVEDIKMMLGTNEGLSLSFDYRDTNTVAHCIANYATGVCLHESWLEVGPQWLNIALLG
nr:uncharacterized protein LOC125422151 [Ziziphus jujuba var. spinosa]